MSEPTRIRWLHPLTIVCGLIVVSEAAVVGYESCAGPPSTSKQSQSPIPQFTFPAVSRSTDEPKASLPAAAARPARSAVESAGVPRTLQQTTPSDATSKPATEPESTPPALASAARTANNEIANALRGQIARLEEELRSGDAGDEVESKRKQLIQARDSLSRLESGDTSAATKAAGGDPDAAKR